MSLGLLPVGNLSWTGSPSLSNSMVFPFSHNSSLFSNAATWSFAFEFLFGFCRSRAGIICITFKAMFSKGEWSLYKFISLVISLINVLASPPLGTMNIFFRQYTIFSYTCWMSLSKILPGTSFLLLLEFYHLKHYLLTSVAEHYRLAFFCIFSSVVLILCSYRIFCCTARIWIHFYSPLFQACCQLRVFHSFT